MKVCFFSSYDICIRPAVVLLSDPQTESRRTRVSVLCVSVCSPIVSVLYLRITTPSGRRLSNSSMISLLSFLIVVSPFLLYFKFVILLASASKCIAYPWALTSFCMTLQTLLHVSLCALVRASPSLGKCTECELHSRVGPHADCSECMHLTCLSICSRIYALQFVSSVDRPGPSE